MLLYTFEEYTVITHLHDMR